MQVISDDKLKTMLETLPEDQRQVLGDIIADKITGRVHCQSKKCKGRVIAVIYDNGRIHPIASPDKKGVDVLWLRSSRNRLDGGIGFECWCGNDSRLSEEEKPHIDYNGNPPTKSGLMEIYEATSGNKDKYPWRNGTREIDGFIIEGVK